MLHSSALVFRRYRCAAALPGILLAVGLFLVTPPGARAAEGADRPNIVLIMADDMGFSDLGCYGGEIQTPNLDRLASQGMRFTQFYNNAKCTTTRASLLTGLYPRQGGRGINLLDNRMITLGEALQRAGYDTALSGKWHLGSEEPHRPIDRGFNEFYGLMDGCCNFFDPSIPDPPFKGSRVRVFAHNDERITEFPDDYYTTDAFSDHAVQTIRRHEDSDRPFFLNVTYTAPHYPLHAKPRDIAKYEGRYTVGWDRIRQRRHQRQIELGLIDPEWTLPTSDPRVTPWAEQENKPYMDKLMAVYAAMVHSMDRGIGRILRALDETHQDDETIVMFLSDNGGCAETPGGIDTSRVPGPKEHYTAVGPGWAFAQDTPFRRYKAWCHEGGIATPLIVRYPGEVEPGSSTDQVGHIIDFMPTLLEVAGFEYPETHNGHDLRPLEGKSLMPVLRGRQREAHDALYWHWAGSRAVRQGRWKAVLGRGADEWELYDMVEDRTETNDLAERYPERVESLVADWRKWAKKTGVIKKK